MPGDEAHVLLDAGGLQAVHQFLPHRLDAHAHLAQLGFPLGAQFRRGQHRGHDGAAVGRRVAVVGADHDLELAQHTAHFFLVFAHHAQRADTLTVQAEALAEAGGHKKQQAGVNKLANHGAVFLQAITKALVSHVKERHQVFGLDHGNHLVPLGRADVVTGGVVAAGVQHHDGAGRGRVQVGQHAVEVERAGGGVVIAVRPHRETGVGEQRAVVFPARVADQHLGAGAQVFQKVGAHLEAAGATNGLDRGHTA